MWFPLVISVGLVTLGAWLYFRDQYRSAITVAADIAETYEESQILNHRPHTYDLNMIIPVCVSVVSAVVQYLRIQPISTIFVTSILTLSLTYLVMQRVKHSQRNKRLKEIEFYLPIVMERIVMAVESGLDILPALQTVVDMETNSKDERENDPVTRLFAKVLHLTDSGMSFDSALHEVCRDVPSPSLKHACIHLGVAFRDGGELIGPLRELSDATQAYYQETIEEEIAKLPVKATMPLVLTFAGLIVFFLASPLVQIMQFSSEAVAR